MIIQSLEMKGVLALILVLTFVSLAQSALMSVHFLRGSHGQETKATPRQFRGIPDEVQQFFVKNAVKTKWYRKGLWFIQKVLKSMRKNYDRDQFVRLYK